LGRNALPFRVDPPVFVGNNGGNVVW
jgi:hypothetical protein